MGAAIDRYLNVQMAYAPVFTADGHGLYFLSNVTGMPQVWRVPAAQSDRPVWPTQLTFETDRVLGVWAVAGQPQQLVYARDAGGNENAQLFHLDAAAAAVTPLTPDQEHVMHMVAGQSADGSALLLGANRDDGARFDLYRLPLDGGEAKRLWINDSPGYLWATTAAPDGSRIVVTRTLSSFEHDLLEVDTASGAARRLWETEEAARFLQPAFSPDGQVLYVGTDFGSDRCELRAYELTTGRWETLVAADWELELLALDPAGRQLAYTLNAGGASRLFVHDLARGATREAPLGAVPGVVGQWDGRLSWSPDGTRLAFSFSSAVRTVDIFVWDLVTGALFPVTAVSHGGLPLDSFAVPRLIDYPTFDGRTIPAWYFPPQDTAAPSPVIVMVHGGPEGQSRPSFNFLAHYFHHAGYAVLLPNVRGSDGYGKAYSHLDDVEQRMDSVADLAHAAHWLAAQPEIDGGRIVVYGGSYGGFMVLAALTAYPDLWAAGIDIVGISNLATFLENTSPYRRAHREAEYGSLARDRAFLESIAPINHVARITAPLLVIHGANDPRVPLSEAQQLVATLQARAHPVELLVFDDEGHGIAKLHNKQVAYPALVDFLARHL